MNAPSSALARLQASRSRLAHAVNAGSLRAPPANPLHALLQRLLLDYVGRLFKSSSMAANGPPRAQEPFLGHWLQQHPGRAMALAFAGGLALALLRPWRWRMPPPWALAVLTQTLLPWWLAQSSPTSPPPSPPRTPP
jgi:hypothetical protein